MTLDRGGVAAVSLAVSVANIKEESVKAENLRKLGRAVATRLATIMTDFEKFYNFLISPEGLKDTINNVESWAVDRDKYIFTAALYIQSLCIVRQGMKDLDMEDDSLYSVICDMCNIGEKIVGDGKRYLDRVEAFARAIAVRRGKSDTTNYLQIHKIPNHIQMAFLEAYFYMAAMSDNELERIIEAGGIV